MGKLSKEEVARYSGANWLIEYAKKNGLEAAEQELQRRGARQIPLAMNKPDVERFEEYTKKNTIATVLMMAVMTLRDEFGFGTERINRFIDRFNNKTSCLCEGYVYWKDLQDTIYEETGVFIPLPDEFMEGLR